MYEHNENDYLEDRFDVEGTLTSREELPTRYEYQGWVINPMTTKRFEVFAPQDYESSSFKREFIPFE